MVRDVLGQGNESHGSEQHEDADHVREAADQPIPEGNFKATRTILACVGAVLGLYVIIADMFGVTIDQIIVVKKI